MTFDTWMQYVVASPAVIVTIVAGIGGCLVMGTLFFRHGKSRRKLNPPVQQSAKPMPHLAMVLPCKGIQENSRRVWEAQLRTEYRGPITFIFVTESRDDPAYAQIQEIISSVSIPDRKATVVSGGLTWHNSQKIHNMLVGLRQVPEEADIVLFLDNDILINGAALQQMIEQMEDKDIVAVTGYSVEVPAPHGSIGSYSVVTFRAIQLLGYMTDTPTFVWGGCFGLRREYLFNNRDCVLDILRDGCYSEDMTLGSRFRKANLVVKAPLSCLFPNPLPQNLSLRSYYQFMCRQYFVLYTYSTPYNGFHNKIQVLQMMLSGVLYSIPILLVCIQFVSTLIYAFWKPNQNNWTGDEWRWLWAPIACISLFLISFVYLCLGTRYMIRCAMDMIQRWDGPGGENYSLNIAKMMAGFLFHAFCIIGANISAMFHSSIIWSQILYKRKKGRVVEMHRPNKMGFFTLTSDRDESMFEELREDIKAGLPSRFVHKGPLGISSGTSPPSSTATGVGTADTEALLR